MFDYSFIFVIINTWLVVHICKCNKVHLLLKILLCVSYIGWNAIPAVLMYIPKLIGRDDVATSAYIYCSYLNEVYLFVAYSLAFLWIRRKRIPKILKNKGFQDNNTILNIMIYSSIILSLFKIYSTLNNTASYWEQNDLANAEALGPLEFLSGYGFSFLVGVTFFYKDRVKPFLFKVCIVIVCGNFLLLTFRGGRIYIFGVVILFLYYAIKYNKKKELIIGSIIGFFAMGLLPVLASLRGAEQISIDEVAAVATTPVGDKVIGEVLTKTNSVMYGSYLIEKDGIGNWDGQMYTSTIFALLPRFIFPSKPEPGSVDGTAEGLAARASAVYSSIGDYNGIGNNGVPASISSLWGGGWLAYIIEILVTAYLIFFLNCLFYANKSVYICFTFTLIVYPVGVLEIPLPTILVTLQRQVVLYLLMVLLFTPFLRAKKRVQNR